MRFFVCDQNLVPQFDCELYCVLKMVGKCWHVIIASNLCPNWIVTVPTIWGKCVYIILLVLGALI